MSAVAIRCARPADAGAIATLLGELGYPARPGAVAERLDRLLGRADAGVLMAEAGDEPAGVGAYQFVDLLERARPQCRITTLVTSPSWRRVGVGAALVGAIAAAARAHDCFRLEVTTQPPRVEALRFYAALGFVERPHRLVHELNAPSSAR